MLFEGDGNGEVQENEEFQAQNTSETALPLRRRLVSAQYAPQKKQRTAEQHRQQGELQYFLTSSSTAKPPEVDFGLLQRLEEDGAVSEGSMAAVVQLMEDTHDADEQLAILRAIRSTAKDPARLQHFVELGGLAVVQRWLEDVLFEPGSSKEFLVEGVALLRAMPLTSERIESTGLRKLVEDLRDFSSTAQDVAVSLLERWDFEREATEASALLETQRWDFEREATEKPAKEVVLSKAERERIEQEASLALLEVHSVASSTAALGNASTSLANVSTAAQSTELRLPGIENKNKTVVGPPEEPEATLEELDKLLTLLEERQARRGIGKTPRESDESESASITGVDKTLLQKNASASKSDIESVLSSAALAQQRELSDDEDDELSPEYPIRHEEAAGSEPDLPDEEKNLDDDDMEDPDLFLKLQAALGPSPSVGNTGSAKAQDAARSSEGHADADVRSGFEQGSPSGLEKHGEIAYFGTVSELGQNDSGGLLECSDAFAQYGCAIFLPGEISKGFAQGDQLVFHVELGIDGLPEARDVRKVASDEAILASP